MKDYEKCCCVVNFVEILLYFLLTDLKCTGINFLKKIYILYYKVLYLVIKSKIKIFEIFKNTLSVIFNDLTTFVL